MLASDDLCDARNAGTLCTTMVLSYLGMCSIGLPLRGPDGRSTVGLLASLPERHDGRLLHIATRIADCQVLQKASPTTLPRASSFEALVD